MSTVILAYNGSLNTTVAIHWLRHKKNMRVITFSADVGQGLDQQPLAQHALNAGAEAAHVVDLKPQFAQEYLMPALQARASYESGYLLGPALTRPLLAREMVKLATVEGAKFIAHGCTPKGNDQVRFETSFATLAPHLECIAPTRLWPMSSREELKDYAARYDISLLEEVEETHSFERCLWGSSLRVGSHSNPWDKIDAKVFSMTKSIPDTPEKARIFELSFENGVPVAIDGERMDLVALITRLNEWGGEHGVGRIDTIENRLTGMKIRAVYEAPGATILHAAHQAIEDIVLSKDILHFTPPLSRRYGELIYEGTFFSELRMALDAFFQSFQRFVTGDVRIKLHHSSCHLIGRRSPYSQYDLKFEHEQFLNPLRGREGEGFMAITKLPQLAEATVRRLHQRHQDESKSV